MNIYRSVKFSADRAAEIAPIKCGLPGSGFFRVPAQRAKPARVSFTIASTRPGRYVAGFGMIIPDQRFTVFCALINPVPERDVREKQKRRTANRQESFAHRRQFNMAGKSSGRLPFSLPISDIGQEVRRQRICLAFQIRKPLIPIL